MPLDRCSKTRRKMSNLPDATIKFLANLLIKSETASPFVLSHDCLPILSLSFVAIFMITQI